MVIISNPCDIMFGVVERNSIENNVGGRNIAMDSSTAAASSE